MTYKAVIMAGGEGTRMRPFTHTIPKPLLPLGRKPIGQIIIERLRACGIREIIMALGYRSDLLRAYFQSGEQFGVNIRYFVDPARLGTAGALAYLDDLDAAPFLVTNGDILTDLDYARFLEEHTASGAALTVAVRTAEMPIPYGVMELEGDRVKGVREKPVYTYQFNAGIYAVSPEARKLVPRGQCFHMTDLINATITAGLEVRAKELSGLWFDLARVDDFEKALHQIEQHYPDLLS
ncbi:MAG: hypothetical protein KatS3mg130_1652 [Candidatus Sumerlaea sp.]|nr:MAG: hypothetical protein KatS3mg130_1652 [Candidatus Sumerlaea sp.]